MIDIDLLQIDEFLDDDACERLRGELQAAAGAAATVTGLTETVQPLVRRTTRAAMPPAARDRVRELLLARKDTLERHFGVTLATCEEPQFRKIPPIISLSGSSPEPSPGTYGGGVLTFHDPVFGSPKRLPLTPPPGTVVAFRAETTHEVTPVTHGERFTIVTWYR